MPSRALLATLAFSLAIPALAQQPVYPSFPPPPAPSGDNAPHPQAPDNPAPYPDSGYPPAQNPDGQNPDVQSQARPPHNPQSGQAAPQKPSPYPPDEQNPAAQNPDPQGGQQSYPPQQYPQQSAPAYPPPGGYLAWVPQGMEALGRTAAFHTDFTFDRSMLQLASGFWEGPVDPATASAISRLDGISVHSYHYAAPGMYDPRMLNVVRQQYTRLGWQHLVSAHSAANGGATDLWISFHHMQATGAVVLFQSATNLNLIAFSGNLSPLDILHLRGHFGIPRFPGDRFQSAPGPAARVAPPY